MLLLPAARARYDRQLDAAYAAQRRAASCRQNAPAAAMYSEKKSRAGQAQAQTAAGQASRPSGILDFVKTAGRLIFGFTGIVFAFKVFALLAALLSTLLPVFMCLAIGFYLLKALSRLLAR